MGPEGGLDRQDGQHVVELVTEFAGLVLETAADVFYTYPDHKQATTRGTAVSAHAQFLAHVYAFLGPDGFWLTGLDRLKCARSVRTLHPELVPDVNELEGGLKALAAAYVGLFRRGTHPEQLPFELAHHALHYRDSDTAAR